MKKVPAKVSMAQDDIDFLEEYKGKFTMDKNSGFHFYAAKETLQRVRDILSKYFLEPGVELYPALVNCSGCDETVDMVHYTYDCYADYLRKGGDFEQA